MLEICRLCLDDILDAITELTTYNDSTSYEIQMKLLMPEIDTTFTSTFTLCQKCSDALNAAYAFKCGCLETEECIKDYQARTNTALIDLRSVKDYQLNSDNALVSECKVKVETGDNSYEQQILIENHIGETKEVLQDHKQCENYDDPKMRQEHEDCNDIFPKLELHVDENEFKEIEGHVNALNNQCEVKNQEGTDTSLSDCKIKIEVADDGCEQNTSTVNLEGEIKDISQDYKEQYENYDDHKIKQEYENCNEIYINESKCVEIHQESISTLNMYEDSHGCKIKQALQFVCEKGNIICSSKSELEEHSATIHTNIKGYLCPVCGKSFTHKRYMLRHQNIHLKTVYRCRKCARQFRSAYYVKNHQLKCQDVPDSQVKIKQINIGSESHVCNVCYQSFKDPAKLEEHSRKHLKQPHPKYSCGGCKKKFNTKDKLMQHSVTHTRIKSFFCPVCDRGFSRFSSLQQHRETHLTKRHECPICMKIFKTIRSLKDHQTNIHQSRYICDMCGLKCSSSEMLKEHLETHANDDRPFKCEICGEGFSARRVLGEHMKSAHDGEKPFKCEVCTTAFALKGLLAEHMTVHAGVPKEKFRCNVGNCRNTFDKARNLINHIRRHNLPKNCKCAYCDKGFKDIASLERHVRIHTGEKPFNCHICGKDFRQKASLATHLKTHRPKEKTIQK